jgi:hypothetical protein
MSNASQAQAVVFELFQDLGSFNIDDYKPLSDTSAGMGALERFIKVAVESDGKKFAPMGPGAWQVLNGDGTTVEVNFVADRDLALTDERLSLIGLDHPLIADYLERLRSTTAENLGFSVKALDSRKGILSLWYVAATDDKHRRRSVVVCLAVDSENRRSPSMEKLADQLFELEPSAPSMDRKQAAERLADVIEPMLHRDLLHRGLVKPGQAYETDLVGWIEVV